MRIALIGNGNLAWHLSQAFQKAGLQIDAHLSRNSSASLGWKLYHSWEEMPADFDLYLLAVPDTSIAEAANHISPNASVVHFSGGSSISLLPHQHRAVCWPCQTLTRGTELDYFDIPIVYESSDEHIQSLIDQSLKRAWGNWTMANEDQRMLAHAAAVFSNNFTNHMQHIAHQLLHEANLPTRLLQPMVKAHMQLLDKHEPSKVQTGPAKRNDIETIHRHIALLQSHPDWKKVYEIISEDIINNYHKKY
jgi:predicted short-subunit dehydrogenase-like oxidoreductase (DUF2520 family)